MSLNYQNIVEELLNFLSPRQKEVIIRRFGLHHQEPESLQEIGNDYKVCRERIRQIQERALEVLQERVKENKKIFVYFKEHLKKHGGLRKEELLLSHFDREGIFLNHIAFLLNLVKDLERHREDQELHTMRNLSKKNLKKDKEIIYYINKFFEKINRPLPLQDLVSETSRKLKLHSLHLISCLEVSKLIDKGPTGFWGLVKWPEINPQGVRDKAFIIFKQEQRPLHFREVADKINELFFHRGLSQRKALPQTVHNELIKDSRFVLIGRGLYALREWGFKEGSVKDILIDILKNSPKPLTKQEILQQVASQRLVKENTVLLNLADKKLFTKDQDGRYKLLENFRA